MLLLISWLLFFNTGSAYGIVYCKCSKILNTSLKCSQIKCWFLGLEFTKLVRMAYREDPDQTASSEAV